MKYYRLNKEDWNNTLEKLLTTRDIYATFCNDYSQDYEAVTSSNIPRISYNKPKPVTPLKSFFLPIKENVTSPGDVTKSRIIIGVPNCDVEALKILDEIYLDEGYEDIFYRNRRENTVIISSDCFSVQEHCHCLTYNIKPYSEHIADMAVIQDESSVILRIISDKGESLASEIENAELISDDSLTTSVENKHRKTEYLLLHNHRELPDYKRTGTLVKAAKTAIWEKSSKNCVSCGACTTICPTCTCFLLIDKPGFHKVKQMDACQYPGFERIAGGEDGLRDLHNRFRNRYMCKYVWKPSRFSASACTGCGRCIEACIGKINKNDIFISMSG
jgi:sulfhydrogenase subunit beta (sulfur reductase)